MTRIQRFILLGGAGLLLVIALLFILTVVALAAPPTPTPFPQGAIRGWVGGMMGNRGGIMMGGGWSGLGLTAGPTGTVPFGCPMHGGWGYPGTGTPISMDQAIQAAQTYMAGYGNPDLYVTEVMEFSQNFYAEVAERSTGIHAFELLINRWTGAVSPEPGPNMMWNTKYGHMGGMMGRAWGSLPFMGRGAVPSPGGTMPVTPAQARQAAQAWLDQYFPGTQAAEEVDTFYGYYGLHVLQNGHIYGMLSVNGYTGAVWYHTWHGDFITMRELD